MVQQLMDEQSSLDKNDFLKNMHGFSYMFFLSYLNHYAVDRSIEKKKITIH
jgi:hypothetical protein